MYKHTRIQMNAGIYVDLIISLTCYQHFYSKREHNPPWKTFLTDNVQTPQESDIHVFCCLHAATQEVTHSHHARTCRHFPLLVEMKAPPVSPLKRVEPVALIFFLSTHLDVIESIKPQRRYGLTGEKKGRYAEWGSRENLNLISKWSFPGQGPSHV